MHWRKITAIKDAQKLATKVCLHGKELPPPPLVVTITRIGPRKLDDDNLQSSCKYVRDMIAAAVGIDDGSAQYTWRYAQLTGAYGVDVEVTSRTDMSPAIS